MDYRTRLTLLTTVAVSATIVGTALAVWALARQQVYGSIDRSLRDRVEISQALGFDGSGRPQPVPFGGPGSAGGFARFLDEDAQVIQPDPGPARDGARESSDGRSAPPPPRGRVEDLPHRFRIEFERARDTKLPVTASARRAVRRRDDLMMETVAVKGIRYRMATGYIGEGKTLQVARPLDESDAFIRRLELVIAGIGLTGMLVSGLLAMLVTRTASRPIAELTELTEAVRTSGDLSRRVDVLGDDDLSRLAASFNDMLEELDASVRAQQQLIDDASHELRTPLTSIRTNLDVLLRAPTLEAPIAAEILQDLLVQVEELSALVRDLVDLASGVPSEVVVEDVRIDVVASDAIRRVRGEFPAVTFTTDMVELSRPAVRERVSRLVGNLVHNAAKWSPSAGTVHVVLTSSELRVHDQGPGVPDADKDAVFERFRRLPSSLDTPGSGLGLAIVAQVARDHGWRVAIEDGSEGGSVFRVSFSGAE